jgi:hypothetical protein
MLRVETADLTKRYGPRAVVDYARTSPDPQEGKENAMFANRSWSRPWAATVAGLAVGALGIAILWASGVEFPIYPPPGIVILLTGALFVGLAPWRWAPDAGAFLGLFVTLGFLISPTGLTNLFGRAGTSVLIGTWIQMIGVLTSLIAGVIATRANYQKPAQARR